MSRPEVSVIIPVHNAADTLVEQLDSVHAAQADAPTGEILVVDNRSTDGSVAVATEWARGRTSICGSSTPPNGPASPSPATSDSPRPVATTSSIATPTTGSPPHGSRRWTEALRSAPYATGPIDMYALNPPWIADVRGSSVTGRSTMYDCVPYAHGCNMGFRRDALVALGGFDETYTAGCDLDIAIRMWEAGHDLGYHEGARIHYRLRPTLRETCRQGIFYGRFRVRIRERLRSAGVGSAAERRTARRILWLARRTPAAMLSRRTRARWVWVLGQLIGERRGAKELEAAA